MTLVNAGFLMIAMCNKPFTICITRNDVVDQLELDERSNDFARNDGAAFYYIPDGFLSTE